MTEPANVTAISAAPRARRSRSPRTQAATVAAAQAPASEQQQPEAPSACRPMPAEEVLKTTMRALLARFTLHAVLDCAWETSTALFRERQEASKS